MTFNPEYLTALAELQRLAASSEQKLLSGSPLESMRESMRRYGEQMQEHHRSTLPPESSYIVEDKLIPVEGGQIRLRIVIPTADDKEKTFPAHVWFHGGDDHSHRLAPEQPFPVGVNDSFTALKWTVENAASIHVDPSKGLVVGGDSAGGNLAVSLGHLARDDPFFEGRPVTGMLLREPSTIHPDAYPDEYKAELLSYEEYQSTPTLTKQGLIGVRAYLKAPATDPRYSSLLFPSHAGLAPAFIQHNECDPLRDDGRVMEKAILQAGGKVKSVLYPGVPHAFYYQTPGILLAQKAWRDTEEGLKWLLSGAL